MRYNERMNIQPTHKVTQLTRETQPSPIDFKEKNE